MNKPIINPWIQSSCFLCCSLIASMPTAAQVTADGTTSTTVTSPDGNNFTIDGGNKPEGGANLFHSFQDFSVPTGSSAAFNNAVDIKNIFSRVTGGNVSNIDGLIRANGSANLFLINPAGIIFGQNARLDLGGSFLGSTADSILFPNGEFSAVDLDNPPLLTINAPIGLGIRDEPAAITNQSVAENVGLRVEPGNTLALIGGDITFNGGRINSPGSNIDLGGLLATGTITIEDNFNFSFPQGVERADVTLTNAAEVNVQAGGGGSITVNARNINLAGGELGASSLLAGIAPDSGSVNAQAGDITLNAEDTISVSQESRIFNRVEESGVGNSGGITITTTNLSLTQGGIVSSRTFGQGDGGEITIDASDTISVDGERSDGFPSAIISSVGDTGEGNAGGINITTTDLFLTQGGFISASAFGKGNGNAININASGTISADGEGSLLVPSVIASQVSPTGEGNAGGINITTTDLSLTQGGFISASTFGKGDGSGNGGNIQINADRVKLENGLINASTLGTGSGGTVKINATESVEITGLGFASLQANVITPLLLDPTSLNNADINASLFQGILAATSGQGEAGGIEINTQRLSISEGSLIATATLGERSAGGIVINTPDLLEIKGSIVSTSTTGTGEAGDIGINTGQLSVSDGGQVLASTLGSGDAGNLSIEATELVELRGVFDSNTPTGLVVGAQQAETTGNGGDLQISTPQLIVRDGAVITATTLGSGNGGNIQIDATNTVNVFNNGSISVNSQSQAGNLSIQAHSLALENGASLSASTPVGTGGNITLEIAENLTLRENSTISAQASGDANGGNITIDADFIIASLNENNDIIASAQQGRGGKIEITVEGIFNIQERPLNPVTNDINASSEFGLDGTVSIKTPDTSALQEKVKTPEIVKLETLGAKACSSIETTAEISRFEVAGKGGIAPTPTAPLTADVLVIEGKSSPTGAGQLEKVQQQQIKPIVTAKGLIYPARGIILQENGDIILTAYPTDNVQRTPQHSPNCRKS